MHLRNKEPFCPRLRTACRPPSCRVCSFLSLMLIVLVSLCWEYLLHLDAEGDLGKSCSLLDVIEFAVWNFVQGRGLNAGWFLSNLPPARSVATWSAKELDQKLHVLSRWENFRSHAEWHAFVMAQIRPLNLDTNTTFRYLEVGVGVGAFSREIIHTFPHATGHGFDLVPRAIEVAAVVLPRDKVEVTVGDMVDIHEPSHSFDLVFVPGALCYLSSMHMVRTAVAGFSRVLRREGGVCIHMLASEDSPMGSCNVRIPKAFWKEDVQQKPFELKLISMEEMSSWGLEHALGRYAVCLQKLGGGGAPSLALSKL
jgi:SAM-dependent methyltransferase